MAKRGCSFSPIVVFHSILFSKWLVPVVQKALFQGVTRKDHNINLRSCLFSAAALLFSTVLVPTLMPETAQAQTRTPPYWASISSDEARMRVGPSLDYPSNWVYRRRDLPVRVLQIHGNWRKVVDEVGAQGWMHVRLLSDVRTAMISTDEGRIYKSADDGSALLYRAEKGVVGRLGSCSGGWCLIDIGGKKGYIHTSSLWGAVR